MIIGTDIIGLILGLVLFICCVKAYTMGLEHGKQLSKDNVPKLNLNPVKAVTEAVKEINKEKQAEALTDELTEIMSFNMESALNAVKKER